MAKREAAQNSDAKPTVEMAVLSIKMTPDFHAWLGELAETERETVVKLIEKSVVDYAKKVGFAKPAPKRTVR